MPIIQAIRQKARTKYKNQGRNVVIKYLIKLIKLRIITETCICPNKEKTQNPKPAIKNNLRPSLQPWNNAPRPHIRLHHNS